MRSRVGGILEAAALARFADGLGMGGERVKVWFEQQGRWSYH